MPAPFKIEINRYEVPLDYPIDVFEVILQTKDASWERSFASEEALTTFLQGLEAATEMIFRDGSLSIPPIPDESKPLPNVPSSSSGRGDDQGFDEIPF